MKQLESVEQYLVEQLGKTQNTQRKALENLHSVVQLCNQKIVAPEKPGGLSALNQASSSSLLNNRNQKHLKQNGPQTLEPLNLETGG